MIGNERDYDCYSYSMYYKDTIDDYLLFWLGRAMRAKTGVKVT